MTEQRTLSLGFREFHPTNYERLVEIYNANYPDYRISVAERRSRDESVDRTKYLLKRYECVDQEHDKIVGFGELLNLPDMYHPRKFMASILVDTEHHCRGVGRAIYNHLGEELAQRHAILAWTMAKEDLPRRVEFFERTRNWESRLDLSTTDTTVPEIRRQGSEGRNNVHNTRRRTPSWSGFVEEDPRTRPADPGRHASRS